MTLRSTERVRSSAQGAARWGLGHALPWTVIRSGARRGDLHSRAMLHANRSQEMPIELFEQLRAAGPFYLGRLSYVTAHLSVVKEVLGSPDVRAGIDARGDSVLGRVGGWAQLTAPLGPLTPPSLLATEPPDHTRMRKLVSRVFSVKAVQRLQERTEGIADELLDRMPTDGVVDLVDAYCAALPVTVICEILGVPAQERDRVRAFGSAAAPSLDVGLSWRRFREVEGSLRSFDDWLGAHVQRVRRDPGDDLLSQLVAARDDDGTALTDRELRSTAALVLAAGFETTVNLIGNGTALLAADPLQREAAVADPGSWSHVVEEVLRFDPPVLLTGRTVVRDTRIAGVPIPAGTLVTTLLAAANRDPSVFEDPHRFDITRANAREHVSFSAGRHFCLGAALARMEGVVAMRKLHERFPQLTLDGTARRDTRILRGHAVLPARLAARR